MIIKSQSPMHGKAYVTKRLKEIAEKYDIGINDVVRLYNCTDALEEHIILEEIERHKMVRLGLLDEIGKFRK